MSDLLEKTYKNPNGCLEWIGTKNKGGYGTRTVGSRADGTRATKLAHRLSYEIANGELESKMCVLHKCDNPPCINPEHLFAGTRADNHTDMVKKNRRVDLRGEERYNSKLKNHEVMDIKIQLMWGVDQRDIAKKYGVNQTLISAIKTGKVWTHVSPEYYKKTMEDRGYEDRLRKAGL